MAQDVGRDQLAILRIEGMHCHKCEQALQKALLGNMGVHEVEVDFPTGQASVLFDRGSVTVAQLMDSVNGAGYRATGFTQRQAHGAGQP
jgi:copper chaperone CopZ